MYPSVPKKSIIPLLALFLGVELGFENSALARCRILAVDDTPINLLILKRAFREDRELRACELVTANSYRNGQDEILLSALKANRESRASTKLNRAMIGLRRRMTDEEKREKLKPYDVILLDYQLDVNHRGSTLARMIRALLFRKRPYVIAMSAEPENNRALFRSGADSGVLKGSATFTAEIIYLVKQRIFPEFLEPSQDSESEEGLEIEN